MLTIQPSDAGYHNMLLTRQVLTYMRQLHKPVRAEDPDVRIDDEASVRSAQGDDWQGIKF
jgi:hypothetical protein